MAASVQRLLHRLFRGLFHLSNPVDLPAVVAAVSLLSSWRSCVSVIASFSWEICVMHAMNLLSCSMASLTTLVVHNLVEHLFSWAACARKWGRGTSSKNPNNLHSSLLLG